MNARRSPRAEGPLFLAGPPRAGAATAQDAHYARKPVKVVIQLPCRDEAEQLPATLAALPRRLPGVDEVEWLVVDDGSSDDTARVALAHGAHAVLRLPHNRGLARAFCAGLEAACRRGADVIVNVDGDNQYDASAIPELVARVLAGRADIVVGCRPIERIAHFPWWKKRLQRLGSAVVRAAAHVSVDDATSGFRAYSRDAAMRLNVYSNYTYTLETLIQAGQSGLRVEALPVEVNPPTRPSRLIRSVPQRAAVRDPLGADHRALFPHLPAAGVLPGAVGAVHGRRRTDRRALSLPLRPRRRRRPRAIADPVGAADRGRHGRRGGGVAGQPVGGQPAPAGRAAAEPAPRGVAAAGLKPYRRGRYSRSRCLQSRHVQTDTARTRAVRSPRS
ncbi:glycosyltransferase family 2 protein [Lysobacter enzymogenes]|uniref:glycosyltransferase family 2 protein n=1 Tax=Lysobacter enzymogenes TaxID=69 RepID=UPI000A7EA072|nr:glycosyltransferase family 2 protein [Lysobacter enzymogenes]